MADQKISELQSSTPQDGDNFAIERSALSNWKVSFSALRTWLAAAFAPLSHVDSTDGHPNATPSTAGFQSAADKTKLDGVDAGANNYAHPNHTGDVTSVGDGAQTIANNAVTNAKAADMAANTVKLRASTTGDPTDSTVEALAERTTPAGTDVLLGQIAGGDLVKVPVGNLPTGGGGEANTSSNQGGGVGLALNKSGIDLPFKTFGVQFESDVEGTDLVSIKSGVFLSNVVEDTTPQLGGPLDSNGNRINLATSASAVRGVLYGDELLPRVGLVYSDDGDLWVPGDGAVLLSPGAVDLGGLVDVISLQHTNALGRQVYVSESGTLYGVDPATAWSDSDTYALNQDLGTGTGGGPWIRVGTIECNPGATVEIGERIDYAYEAYAVNQTGNRTGTIEFGVGINGADPASSFGTHPVAPGFAGTIAGSGFVTAVQQLTGTDTLWLYARIAFGDNAQFGVDLDGTVQPSQLAIASSASGGGSGEVNVLLSQGGGVQLDLTKSSPSLPIRTFGVQFEADQEATNLISIKADAFETTGAVAGHEAAGDPHSAASYAIGPGTSSAGNLAVFGGTDGRTLQDGGAPPAAAPTTATFYSVHTYALESVPDGASALVPFYADVVAGQVVTLEAATFRLAGGTATIQVRVKGVAQAFDTAAGADLTPTATAARDTVSSPPNLAQLDDVDVNVTAAASATGLSVTLTFQHVVTLS